MTDVQNHQGGPAADAEVLLAAAMDGPGGEGTWPYQAADPLLRLAGVAALPLYAWLAGLRSAFALYGRVAVAARRRRSHQREDAVALELGQAGGVDPVAGHRPV